MKRETFSVLVLIPNMLQCDLVRLALTRNQMKPIVCEAPDSLRQHLVRDIPDALLIDTSLPGHSGLDLVQQLNSDGSLKYTKVFFVSSLGFPEVVQKAAQMKASGFFVKPLDPDLLVTRIRNCFQIM